ncbi:tRNA (uridine(34)/cytosine(34)/5-carboxymethylaminomethyluridine(34)-2'-O)-methyltransferase TrmL [Epidermidibacterium keratini]|uniref:Putative tRNA (cytidine(34)-2'-O)-methyltransferase n=1 Tax=Epidermidibacterium keratini TaxID=1891644 RepID=A0A7L4YPD1_9ACTN|nr:tRNA (cytidine(34)-2'-O)-methyltransferase [Epidermidibacterium keratini]QHC00734.1 tRNA (uridine(34)/cytosine(34)/5-carboxymethylaminomethyluridine(34)-2'-O)-methyltransferase TrmL [Epidermidibacterium keratini]
MFHVVFYQPQIPPNTGNAIRLVACTGATLHLIEPLGFTLEDKQLRRAGLDYHDLAQVAVHPSLDACLDQLTGSRVFAFTRHASASYADIAYAPGDVLLFGREEDGLPAAVLDHPRVSEQVRFPMIEGRRSLNLSNCAAIATYEAWRQNGFGGLE